MARKNKAFTGPRSADAPMPAHMTCDVAEIPEMPTNPEPVAVKYALAPFASTPAQRKPAPKARSRKPAAQKAISPALAAYLARSASPYKRAYAAALVADATAAVPAKLDAETAAKVARKVARLSRAA